MKINPKFYCLYSGGKDSTVAASVLADSGMLESCVTFDTGISTPDWLEFVQKSCMDRGWPLEIYKTPESYDELVKKYGFPGPGMHGTFMNYLKGRCVRKFKSLHPGGCLASGVRSLESKRRLGHVKEWSVFEGVPVYAPIFDWSTEKTWEYFNNHKFDRSPAYATLCISGDCLCGAYASKGERELIRDFYPTVHARLLDLERATGKVWGARSMSKRRKSSTPTALCIDCDIRHKQEN